jgi:hypothetical protein
MSLTIEVELYSWKYGRNDRYKILFDKDKMRVTQLPSSIQNEQFAECILDKNGEPSWSSGYTVEMGNPLELILENESSYPPIIFVEALEYAWETWRKDELNDQNISEEVKKLCNWVNNIIRVDKPISDFWSSIF